MELTSEKYDDLIMRFDTVSGVLHITLDRVHSRNAMSSGMVDSLLALLRDRRAHAAGAILLDGAGKGFCAGSDLTGLAAMTPLERGLFEADCAFLAQAMVAFPRPIIAAVHGFAIGGGLTLAAAADIVVTAPDTRWSLPEVPIGLFPAWGLAAVSRRTGAVRARRLAWGIDTLDGATAASWGLADIVADTPRDRAKEIAARLASLPVGQVAAVKEHFAIDRHADDSDRHANRLFLAACETPAAKASFTKFGKG